VATLKLKLFVYRASGTNQKVVLPGTMRAAMKSMGTEAERKRFLVEKNLKKEEIDGHPFLELVSNPNGTMTRFTLWYNTMIRMELNGSCPWYVPRGRLGIPVEIWPLPITKTASVTPRVDTRLRVTSWQYRDGDLVTEFAPEEVIFMAYPHPASPFRGMSPLLAQTELYDIDLFLSRSQRNLFENRMLPGLNLTTKDNLGPEQAEELRQFLTSQLRGVEKVGELLITHSGLEAKQLSLTNKDALISEIADYARQGLLASFDLSDGKVGLVKDANRANMEALNDTYVMDCLRPKTMMIEEYIESKLLPKYDQGLTCDFQLPDVSNREMELKENELRLKYFIDSPNKFLERAGEDPVPWGDKPWIPGMLVPAGEKPPQPAAQPPQPGAQAPPPAPPVPPKKPSKGNGLDADSDEKEEDLIGWTEPERTDSEGRSSQGSSGGRESTWRS
jgi:HK97 family phage portal protein